MSEYVYTGVKCLHPVRITLHGDYAYVPCGKCEVCLSNKQLRNCASCDFELSTATSVFFVTLTYSNPNVPIMAVYEDTFYKDDNDTDNLYYCYDVTPRYHELKCKNPVVDDDFYLGCLRYPGHMMDDLYYKRVKTNDDISVYNTHYYDLCGNVVDSKSIYYMPYLSHYDVKCFLKRLRYYLNKNKNKNYETLRYYVMGEYGPRTYRPHFHLLLFFQSQITPEDVTSFVYKSWSYGRISVDRVEKNATSYVTRYASGSFILPPLYDLPATKPRLSHSINFGGKVYDCILQSIKDNDDLAFNLLDSVRIAIAGKNREYYVRRSLENRRYPKVPGFTAKNTSLLCLSFRLYQIAIRWALQKRYYAGSLSALSVWFANELLASDPGSDVYSLVEFYTHCVYGDFMRPVTPNMLRHEKFYLQIYRELLVSRKIMDIYNFTIDTPYQDFVSLVKKFVSYYKKQDYDHLKKNLESLELFTITTPFEALKPCFYNTDEFVPCAPYNQYVSYRKNLFYSNMKHKELNDANNIFLYDSKFDKVNYSRKLTSNIYEL